MLPALVAVLPALVAVLPAFVLPAVLPVLAIDRRIRKRVFAMYIMEKKNLLWK